MERHLIYYSAPTLIGDKAGSMFALHNMDESYITSEINKYNRLLYPDIQIQLLRRTERSSLVLVYRRDEIERIIKDGQCRKFLNSLGYECQGVDCVLKTLVSKFVFLYPSMPHEVGVLLDYPLDDVKGFINCHSSHNNKCGYWKSYTDSVNSIRKEAKYNEYKNKAIALYENGHSLLEIIDQHKGGLINEGRSGLLVRHG